MTVAPGLFASPSHMASAPSSAELGAAGAGASGPCAARSSAPRFYPEAPCETSRPGAGVRCLNRVAVMGAGPPDRRFGRVVY